jgi:hypothetical protein
VPRIKLVPALITALCAGALGCDSLGEFRGSYEGKIVSASFVRSCFAEGVVATLSFDPRAAAGGASEGGVPANLLTIEGTFDQTPLVPISVLSSDPLSTLEIPGGDRLRNYILLARPESGPLAGRDAFVVVSLLESHRIELRVIARSEDGSSACDDADAGAGGTEPRQYFGVFSLKSQKK